MKHGFAVYLLAVFGAASLGGCGGTPAATSGTVTTAPSPTAAAVSPRHGPGYTPIPARVLAATLGKGEPATTRAGGIAVVQRIGCKHRDCLQHEIDVVRLLRPGRSTTRLFGPFETAVWGGEEVNSGVDGGQLVSLTPDGRWLTYPGMPWGYSRLVNLRTGWQMNLGPESWPVLSPDGQYLALYHQASIGGGVDLGTFIPDYAAAPQLDSRSGHTRIFNLANGKWSSLGRAGSMPAWSERGDNLTWRVDNHAFATASALHPNKVTLVPAGPCGPSKIQFANPSASNWDTLPFPAWAPNGRSLLCFSASGMSKDGYLSFWNLEDLPLGGGHSRTVARGLTIFEPADNQLSPPPPFPLVLGKTIVCAVSGSEQSAYVQGKTIQWLPDLPYDFQFRTRHQPLLVSWTSNFSNVEHVGTWVPGHGFKSFARAANALWITGWTSEKIRRPT